MRMKLLDIHIVVTGSDENPNLRNGRRVDAQRLFFWRDMASREVLERLIDQKKTLEATLEDAAAHRSMFFWSETDCQGVDVGLELHPEASIDFRNCSGKLISDEASKLLSEELKAYRLSSGACGRCREEMSLRSFIQELRELLRSQRNGACCVVDRLVDCAGVVIDHAEPLDEQWIDALLALAPVYRWIAWAETNDWLSLDREIAQANAEKKEKLKHEPLHLWASTPQAHALSYPRKKDKKRACWSQEKDECF